MSIVTLQVGQCGNQVGGQLYSSVIEDISAKLSNVQISKAKNEDYISQVVDRFFTPESSKVDSEKTILNAKAVMVDMEPKVIAQTCSDAKRSGKWMYPEKQQFCQKRGSGNNWAHGFCVHGPKAEEEIMNLIRKETEKCDRLGGFLLLMSLAGGTGSGVGTHITKNVRDEYPHSFITNQVVWPYNTGEVIVQNYNAVLTLANLYQNVDAIIVMENDHLHKICSQLLNIKKISFKDINDVITHKLSSVLLPAMGDYSTTNSLGDILEHMVPHPEHKLMTIKNIPQMSDKVVEFSTYHWQGLLKHLRQMLIADAYMEEGVDWQVQLGQDASSRSTRHNSSLANMLFLRGKDAATADVSLFQDPKLYTPWMPSTMTFTQLTQPRMFNKYEKSAALLSNSRSPVVPLNHVISKAWTMFSNRAYIHQYLKHGLTEEDFVDSFVILEQVLSSYRKL